MPPKEYSFKFLKLILIFILLFTCTITAFHFNSENTKNLKFKEEQKLIAELFKKSKITKIEFTDLNQRVYKVEIDKDLLDLWYKKILESKIIDHESGEGKYFDDGVVGYLWLETPNRKIMYAELRSSRPLFIEMKTNPEDFNGVFLVFGSTCSVMLKTS